MAAKVARAEATVPVAWVKVEVEATVLVERVKETVSRIERTQRVAREHLQTLDL